MAISRFFVDNSFVRIKKDFPFLVSIVNNSFGEYDLSIRENYFNLYYKGYCIGMIKPTKNELYRVSIHKKFFDRTGADNKKFYIAKKQSGLYWAITLAPNQLHPFFQKKHLIQFASRVNEIPAGELAFEQAIMTDNLSRTDVIIIDRQITDSDLKGKRLDLLALKQMDEKKYHFLLLEVKLGKNNELKGQVNSQIEGYIEHIRNSFVEYKECYEKQFLQKVDLGLIKEPKEIEIVKPVKGQILVGSHSGIADSSIKKLRKVFPELDIKHFKYAL